VKNAPRGFTHARSGRGLSPASTPSDAWAAATQAQNRHLHRMEARRTTREDDLRRFAVRPANTGLIVLCTLDPVSVALPIMPGHIGQTALLVMASRASLLFGLAWDLINFFRPLKLAKLRFVRSGSVPIYVS
jgi:hypothetical protein